MFKFEFSIDDNDYIKFNEYFNYIQNFNKRIYIFSKFIIPIICIFINIINYIYKEDISLKDTIYTISIEIIFFIVFLYFLGFTYKKYIENIVKINIKSCKKNGTLPYDKNIIISFNNEEIIEESNNKSTTYKYDIIEKVIINEDYHYIFFNALEAIILPNYVFKQNKQQKKFDNFLITKIDSNKISKI